jgi:hypothetical protein
VFELKEAATRFWDTCRPAKRVLPPLYASYRYLSFAGRVRCHPEKTIFEQIQEMFEVILRNPDVLIFDSVPEPTQGPQAKPGGPSLLR